MSMNRTVLLPLVSLFLLAGPTAGQAPSVDAQKDAIRRLDWLVGRWTGEGRFFAGPDRTSTGAATETVQPRLDGAVLLIEGRGTAQSGGREVPVHEALGVLSYDPERKKYLLRAYRRGGQSVDADVEVGDRRMVWGFTAPQGRVRFTIRLDEQGRWHEVGEISQDGASWRKYLEMTLTRTKD